MFNYAHQNALRELTSSYLAAKRYVIEAGYANEIDWQDELDFDDLDESSFLRESAWVVLSSGMRETVIRNIFPKISEAFYYWSSSIIIYEKQGLCLCDALQYFNSPRKIQAIIDIATRVHCEGFNNIKSAIQRDSIEYISSLPFMGPATSYHFAKNIGLEVVKPDRHLMRVTEKIGYNTPGALCLDIAKMTGEKVSVIDAVIWRYATLKKDYLNQFPKFAD